MAIRARLATLTLLSVVVAVLCGSAVPADAISIAIDPRQTYLRTNSDAGALTVIPLDLSTLGFSAGQTVLLQRLGDFDCGSPCGDDGTAMIGVFSSSSTLLAPTNVDRVPGAIDAGTDFVTSPTFVGGLATDIAEDFFISGAGTTLVIPTGAAFFFVAAHDSLYFDNTDPNSNFAVQLNVVTAVPEPSSLLLLAAGIVVVALRRQRW